MIKQEIQEKLGGIIDVIPTIDIEGKGRSTKQLIRTAEKMVRNAKVIYQNV